MPLLKYLKLKTVALEICVNIYDHMSQFKAKSMNFDNKILQHQKTLCKKYNLTF